MGQLYPPAFRKLVIAASLCLSYLPHDTLAEEVNRPPILTRRQGKAMKETGYNFLYDTPEVTP